MLLLLVPLAMGCSVVTVLLRPGLRDLKVLKLGTAREALVEELGEPMRSGVDACPDVFDVAEGYSAMGKAWRVPLILVFDVFTLGTAEVEFFKRERQRGTPHVGILVSYDEEGRVASACVYQGYDQVYGRPGAPRRCSDEMLRLGSCGRVRPTHRPASPDSSLHPESGGPLATPGRASCNS
jgi:hypothetical protein